MSPYPTARAESQSNTPAHVRKPVLTTLWPLVWPYTYSS